MTTDVTTAEGQTMAGDLEGTEKLLNFMEEVETYMTYKVASYINDYWFPILVPVGLIGNTLSFLVMMRPNNRKVSTCIYMAAISVNNNIMMCLALRNWLVLVVFRHGLIWECKIAAYFVNFSLQSSAYQILAMTFDKYIAIKWPHRSSVYSTPRRAKIILLAVFLFALIYNGPHLLLANVVGEVCLTYTIGGTVVEMYSWITFLVNGIIPFLLLIHMNYAIVQTVRKSQKMFKSNANATGTGSIAYKNEWVNKRQRTMKNAENQLTIMLLLVTTLFLIFLLPAFIRFIYFSLVERDTPSKYARTILFFEITYKLYTTNNGINFFLYCISGKRFRNDLKEMLCCVVNSPAHKSNTEEMYVQ